MAATKTVSVGNIPGKIFELPFKKDWTARDYLNEIEVENFEGLDIQIDCQSADVDDTVEAGATVLAVGKVKGN